MNEIHQALLSLALAIPLSIIWMAFMYRIRKGNYKVIGSTKTATLFKTSIGEFRLDGGHDKLQVKNGKDGWVGYDTNTIRELSFRQSEEPAWFAEFITGFNLWDLSGRYRDQNILFKIDAVSNDGTYIPLYEASQLEEREFWIWGWWTRLVRSILEFVHLTKNADEHSRAVYDELKAEFQRLGVKV